MTAIVLGCVALAVLLWAIWAKKFGRFNVILGLIAGFTLSGGVLYEVAHKGARVLQTAVSSVSTALIGASVTLVIGVLLCLELWRVLSKKGGGRPHRILHPLLGFLAPVLLMSAGGIFADIAGLLNQGVDTVTDVSGEVLGGGR